MNQLRHFIKKDTKGKSRQADMEQVEDAATQGMWSCHGHTLEPDSDCPVCGRSIFG